MTDTPEQTAGHTAGPWVSETYVDEYGVSVIASDDATYISNPSRGQVCHIGVVAGASGGAPAQAKANARLIAAAPDLLDALRGLVDVVNQPDTPPLAELFAAVADGQAAILRATGAQ